METDLLPALRGALNPKLMYSLLTGFREGDMLHLLAEVAGRPAGTVLPVLGYCLCHDEAGQAYQLRAYVPLSPAFATTFTGREARRFPVAGQQERWLSGTQLYFTELDITDHADALALERPTGGVVIEMYPKPAHALRQAA